MDEPARFTWLVPGLGLLACLGPFSNDVYVPSLSIIAGGLGIDSGSVQLTMTALLMGFSLGSVLFGPLSDRYGRKPVLCLGLAIYALAGLLAALSSGLGPLIAARVLQGFAGSSTMVLTRAIILDRWSGEQASRMLSWTAIFIFTAPVLAPLLGGFIASFNYWPAVLWVQSGVGLLALLLTIAFLPRVRTHRGTGILAGIRTYGLVLKNPGAIGYMMCTGLGFVGVITFVSTSSVVFVDYFGLTPGIQGISFSIVMFGAAIGSFTNGRLVVVRGISGMIGFGTVCLAVGGLLSLFVCIIDAGVVALVAATTVYAFGIGFVFANTVAKTMSHFRENAGAVSALFAINQFLVGAIATAGLSTISTPSLLPLGISLAVAGVAALILWWGWLR
ncbi:MAG: multidrug effflux MFS transporter, partial [Gammaproteobacteria bacterium]